MECSRKLFAHVTHFGCLDHIIEVCFAQIQSFTPIATPIKYIRAWEKTVFALDFKKRSVITLFKATQKSYDLMFLEARCENCFFQTKLFLGSVSSINHISSCS